jgi:hypothetical protein
MLVLAACAIVAVAGWLYLRHPRFSGREAVSVRIFAAETNRGATVIDVTVTNAAALSAIFGVLREATWGVDHTCAALGTLTVRYANGAKDELGFLPSHGEAKFEFRHGWLKYNVPRERLYQTLEAAGVDTAAIPTGQ